MAWPKGKPRKAKFVISAKEIAAATAEIVMESFDQSSQAIEESTEPQYPSDWHPGMLLNVRNTGPDYTITLWPEEADHRKPERALHFTNPGEAQNFVSTWYSRQSHDPRAR